MLALQCVVMWLEDTLRRASTCREELRNQSVDSWLGLYVQNNAVDQWTGAPNIRPSRVTMAEAGRYHGRGQNTASLRSETQWV